MTPALMLFPGAGFMGSAARFHNLLTRVFGGGVALPVVLMIFGNPWRGMNPWAGPAMLAFLTDQMVLALHLSGRMGQTRAVAHLPMTMLMVGYTVLGLWLLASSTGT